MDMNPVDPVILDPLLKTTEPPSPDSDRPPSRSKDPPDEDDMIDGPPVIDTEPPEPPPDDTPPDMSIDPPGDMPEL
jgi:hypothetical protein